MEIHETRPPDANSKKRKRRSVVYPGIESGSSYNLTSQSQSTSTTTATNLSKDSILTAYVNDTSISSGLQQSLLDNQTTFGKPARKRRKVSFATKEAAVAAQEEEEASESNPEQSDTSNNVDDGNILASVSISPPSEQSQSPEGSLPRSSNKEVRKLITYKEREKAQRRQTEEDNMKEVNEVTRILRPSEDKDQSEVLEITAYHPKGDLRPDGQDGRSASLNALPPSLVLHTTTTSTTSVMLPASTGSISRLNSGRTSPRPPNASKLSGQGRKGTSHTPSREYKKDSSVSLPLSKSALLAASSARSAAQKAVETSAPSRRKSMPLYNPLTHAHESNEQSNSEKDCNTYRSTAKGKERARGVRAAQDPSLYSRSTEDRLPSFKRRRHSADIVPNYDRGNVRPVGALFETERRKGLGADGWPISLDRNVQEKNAGRPSYEIAANNADLDANDSNESAPFVPDSQPADEDTCLFDDRLHLPLGPDRQALPRPLRPVAVPEPSVFRPYLQHGSQDSDSIRQYSSQMSAFGANPQSSQDIANGLIQPSAPKVFPSAWTGAGKASTRRSSHPPRHPSILSTTANVAKDQNRVALSGLLKPRIPLDQARILSKTEAALAEKSANLAVHVQPPTSPGLVSASTMDMYE